MRFRRGAKLDPGQVTDVRGRRMAPGGLAVVAVASASPRSSSICC